MGPPHSLFLMAVHPISITDVPGQMVIEGLANLERTSARPQRLEVVLRAFRCWFDGPGEGTAQQQAVARTMEKILLYRPSWLGIQ